MEITWFGFILSAVMASVLSAPVSQESLDDITSALKTQLNDQEQALASLGSIKDQGNSARSLGMSHSKSFSYSNINGAVNREQTEEHKVMNPAENKLISDVKEHVQQSQKSPELKPKTSFQASIDIPDKGIHKEINDNDEADQGDAFNLPPRDFRETIEFTPEVVAQYLYDHQAKEDFVDLLNNLVETSEISSEKAAEYEKTIFDELYKIEQTDKRNGNDMNLPMMNPVYPQGFMDSPQPMYPMFNEPQPRDDMYPLYGFDQAPMNAPMNLPMNLPMNAQEPNEMDNYMNYFLNRPVSLDDMINTLLDEWLTKAVITGDPEAEEILTNIVDYVSRDNNPNDEEQVKSVLGDIFAEALLEDLTPRIQPEDMKNYDVVPEIKTQVLEPVEVPAEEEVVQSEHLEPEQEGELIEETKKEDNSVSDSNIDASETKDSEKKMK